MASGVFNTPLPLIITFLCVVLNTLADIFINEINKRNSIKSYLFRTFIYKINYKFNE